ncbi:TIGR00269 family protein [Infirmifilum lucidum]|uniref:TIGR00269 family protein n=1 Tax=Infirmifilum lucidum TaxID=2776706 RepID=A0A7L9FI51_9CREN|nr:TIGR00269 family protein [Infirmifilum lucidum]QOJ79470.1 TIGR00269 family protein [Infirmifilum lucidum]
MGRTAKCFVCGSKAVAYVPYLGEYLCKEHFIEYFERRVYETLRSFKLVAPGDRVAVAVSGGKDSLTTLYLLRKFSGRMGFEVFGVAVDEGIAGYREYKLQALSALAEELGVRIYVGRFEDYFGITLDEAVKRLKEKGMEYKPCSVCGVFRRYIINKLARELGATKLATGHNLDDEVQVFVMNALKAHMEGIEREGIASATVGEGLVPRIKPLYFITEKEVLTYTLLRGIHTPFVECPYIVYALRHPIRRWINAVEDEAPGFKYRILAVKELSRKKLPEAPEGAQKCRVCGEPSSKPVCKACLFRAYLDPGFAGRVERLKLISGSRD